MKELNAFKALKDPSHRGTCRRLVNLIGKRFGLGQGLRDAAYPLDTCQVQLLHVRLTIHSIVGHIDIGLFPHFPPSASWPH
jgi:hypothetical protein